MRNQRQNTHEANCRDLALAILKYDRVLLFGPTMAKYKLHNYLDKDLHFKDVRIDPERAHKKTYNEK